MTQEVKAAATTGMPSQRVRVAVSKSLAEACRVFQYLDTEAEVRRFIEEMAATWQGLLERKATVYFDHALSTQTDRSRNNAACWLAGTFPKATPQGESDAALAG